ncbi:MAG: hypothetical protein ACRYG7_48415 [Janthinobacterium lividum]
MKLHILGASGVGVTPLGRAFSAALRIPYLDTDTYFWMPSDPPFTVRRPTATHLLSLGLGITTLIRPSYL